MSTGGEPLSVSSLRANAETVRKAEDRRWILWVYQDIMLWKMVGVWPAPVARVHFTEIWQAFLTLRESCDTVFLLIDTDDFAPQSYEFRDLLVKEWAHVLDRGDLVICLVASDPMRRAVRNTMAMLAGRFDQFRFYKNFEAALRFIERKKRDLASRSVGADGAETTGGHGSSLRTIGDVVDQLTRAHERLALEHDQDLLESEVVGDLEHRFREMFQSFPAAVFYFDLWGKFVWGNRRTEELFGWSMRELVGVPYYESRLAAFEDLVQAARLLADTARPVLAWPREFSAVCQDGNRIRIEVAPEIVTFGTKKVILCLASDLTGRRPKKPGQGAGAARSEVLCSRCHRIRDDSGRWLSPEQYHRLHFGIKFQRGLCPECAGTSEEPSDNGN
ncbi:MAG: PAS domain S-box protein, partial [Spirochaetales bacterium]|nr:PAS domain S-box protein [Spirochaetales bacterium]